MKVLSFDVGIKNLAYCVLEKDINTTRILDWGILNVSIDSICEHCHPKTGVRCDKSATYSCENLLMCSSHCKLKMYSSKKFKKIPKKKDHMLLQGKQIVTKLKEKNTFLDVDVVLIENQPALKNPTMKTIQMIVYSYFLIEGVMSESSSIKDIKMINARNKLKAYTGDPIECSITDKYKKTKYLAVQYCSSMIKDQDEQWINLFTKSNKQDDLAYAYLQGIFVLLKL